MTADPMLGHARYHACNHSSVIDERILRAYGKVAVDIYDAYVVIDWTMGAQHAMKDELPTPRPPVGGVPWETQ